jgi:AIR synthase-related protein
METALQRLAQGLRDSKALAAKSDIASVASSLKLSSKAAVMVGDDCAAIPDGDGYSLFAIEGFMNEFVATDPWFAGWCGVMVNVADVAAMGGRPLAVVNALWCDGWAGASPVLQGLKDASRTFDIPIVGGHTNLRTDRGQFAAAILGRAKKLLTSFDAEPGDCLIAAIDLRGHYREPFSNWEAATNAPPRRLRGDIEVLPQIAEAELSKAAKDISQGGIIGTAIMLAECSAVGLSIELKSIPKPNGVPIDRWLQTFPSFGYMLSVRPDRADAVLARFRTRDIAAARIGDIVPGTTVSICEDDNSEVVWDFSSRSLIGCGTRGSPRREAKSHGSRRFR